MKNRFFQQKINRKNHKKTKQKNHSSTNKRQSRMKSAFWGRYATRNCDKESSHGNAKVLICDGEEK